MDSKVTMERILHVVPYEGGRWQSLCVISDGPKTWFHQAVADTPEAALQAARDWLGMARQRLAAGESVP